MPTLYKASNNFIRSIPCPDNKIYSLAFKLENNNLKLATQILSKFPHSSVKDIKWQDQDLPSIIAKINIDIKYSSRVISQNFPIRSINKLGQVDQLLGGISDSNHGLSSLDKLYIPNLNERQVTDGLALCLNTNDKNCTFRRVLTLLKALPISKDFITVFEEITDLDESTIKVESEVPTKENKRIDILISWESSNKPYGIAIEAKFGHKVTTGQLPTYKNLCKERFEDRYNLVLLTNEGYYNKKNIDWRPLSWLNFLIRLEKGLAKSDCDDNRFSCFRAMLWKKIGGV